MIIFDIQKYQYAKPTSGNLKLKILMEPLDTQSLPFSIEVSRILFRNSRSKRPQRNETNSRNEDAKEILPENRSRQGPEIGANPDGSGRGKIPGFGGRQNLVTFQLKSCLKFDDLGSEQAPGPFGGFSGSPRRDVRRAAKRDLQDDQRHHPRALVHHVFLLSRRLRLSLLRFFFATSSSVRCPFCVQRSE